MARFKFLLVILVVTATITIATFIPTEIHEYGLETQSGALSIYSEFFLSGSWSSAEHCYLWSELDEEASTFAMQTITAKSGTSPATGLYFSHNNDAEVHNEK